MINLLNKLKHLGMRGPALDWFHSNLSNIIISACGI